MQDRGAALVSNNVVSVVVIASSTFRLRERKMFNFCIHGVRIRVCIISFQYATARLPLTHFFPRRIRGAIFTFSVFLLKKKKTIRKTITAKNATAIEIVVYGIFGCKFDRKEKLNSQDVAVATARVHAAVHKVVKNNIIATEKRLNAFGGLDTSRLETECLCVKMTIRYHTSDDLFAFS